MDYTVHTSGVCDAFIVHECYAQVSIPSALSLRPPFYLFILIINCCRWLLHAKYTLPPFLILIEMYMSFHRYPDLMTGFALMFGWAFVYLAWLHFFQYRTGSWLYPFLQDKNARERWVFFSGLFLTLVGCYLLGELLNNNFWRQNLVLLSCNNVAGNKRCQFTQTIKV